MTLSAVVLAAGKGTRMKSDLPKPLHAVRGRSLLAWVIHALAPSNPSAISVVVGHGRELVVESLAASFDRDFLFAEQLSQRGTGDAAAVGLAELDLHDASYSDDDHVIVLPGDTPLLQAETLTELYETHVASGAAATLVTAMLQDPTGYGRIIRGQRGEVREIVEHRDASDEQLAVNEINGGIYCFRRSLLAPALRLISSDNAQNELYLTDAVGVLSEAGHSVMPFPVDEIEISGVNDRSQLGAAAEHVGARIIDEHMRNGVTVVQPSSTVIDADVRIEPDVTVHPGTVIEGTTTIGTGSSIGPHTRLKNAAIGERATVESSSVRDAAVADDRHVGPYESVTG